jgi:hypothetical protein
VQILLSRHFCSVKISGRFRPNDRVYLAEWRPENLATLLNIFSHFVSGHSKVGCRFPRWLSAVPRWDSLDTVADPAPVDGDLRRPGRRVSRVSLSVSAANTSFLQLDVRRRPDQGREEEEGGRGHMQTRQEREIHNCNNYELN